MKKYRIQGGKPLMGTVGIGGAKNAALPIIAAACLNEGETVITNCPAISDIMATVEILEHIGFQVDFTDNTLTIKPKPGGKFNVNLPDEIVGRMRSSILFMGAMLGRFGQVNLAMPGGCKLGVRAIDLHVSGLASMGAAICIANDKLYCHVRKLKGADITLHTPSVGATENLLLAAVKAKGETIIRNAACEPEIIDLVGFLRAMGAKIIGEGTSTIVVQGVNKLKLTKPYRIAPDRIVAGTYLVAAAMTRGMVTIKDISPTDLVPVIKALGDMGCHIHIGKRCITLAAPKRLKALPRLVTAVHPGFPTDMQAQFVAALALAKGTSTVTETIFESRHSHAIALRDMGADITISKDLRTFTIVGKKGLTGARVEASDLRGGAALILAGLAAEGETVVENVMYVERGYASIVEDLVSLGAMIVEE